MPFVPIYTDTTSLPSSSPQSPCTERTCFLLLVLPFSASNVLHPSLPLKYLPLQDFCHFF